MCVCVCVHMLAYVFLNDLMGMFKDLGMLADSGFNRR